MNNNSVIINKLPPKGTKRPSRVVRLLHYIFVKDIAIKVTAIVVAPILWLAAVVVI